MVEVLIVMDPKMSIKDAAAFLGVSTRKLYKRMHELELPYTRQNGTICFGYPTSRQLFRLSPKPQAISFQIVKGGTGKTSLACAIATRANLYGLRVLCIDLDQQGNLTNSFGVDADSLPVMVDILAEGYTFEDAITRVYPGMDILASRIENALIDDVIKIKGLDLASVYREPLQELKQKYDLIVIDCPPNLGQSVAAVTLAVDNVVAPVVPESYALAGLKATKNAISELQQNYHCHISLTTVVNKFDQKAYLSVEAKEMLENTHLCVHLSSEFPNAIAKGESVFDSVKSNQAKQDIDRLTQKLLGIDNYASVSRNFREYSSNFDELAV